MDPSSSGISSRSSVELASRPPASARSTSSLASSSQRSPSGYSPALSTSLMSLRRSAPATRSLAPDCATFIVSRGNTNSVRRIDRCFTSERFA